MEGRSRGLLFVMGTCAACELFFVLFLRVWMCECKRCVYDRCGA
jgi:hypothetical protein